MGQIDSGSSSRERETPQYQDNQANDVECVQSDGGFQAYLVVFCAAICQGVIFGIHNSFGVIFVHLEKIHGEDPNSAMKVSLVGTIGFGAIFFLSPVTGILADKLGIRPTAFIGSAIAALGMFASSFFVDHLMPLYFAYGLFGIGSSLIYTPTIAILVHYFKKRIGLANGLVRAGGCIFTILMPSSLSFLLDKFEMCNTLRLLSGLIATLMIFVLSFKPTIKTPAIASEDSRNFIQKICHVDNFKNKKYIIWALSVPVALLGYFVPFVHLIKYAEDTVQDMSGDILLICIAISSSIGRLLCGKICDLPAVSPILLEQVSFAALGVSIMMFSTVGYFGAYMFHALIAFSLAFGFFEGCFITMFGPIGFELCGPVGATQGIAFMLGLSSIPQTIGAPIAGFIYDRTQSYGTSFLAAGIPPIIGALLMSFIYVAPGGNIISHEENPEKNEEQSNYGGKSQELENVRCKYVKTEDRPIFTILISERESELRPI